MNSLRKQSGIAVKNSHINFEHPNPLIIRKKVAGILLFRHIIEMCTLSGTFFKHLAMLIENFLYLNRYKLPGL
jgi:hypothetical protein